MDGDRQYSVEDARAAADRQELADWVVGFLASPGSDNALLGMKLSEELGWWTGPLRLPLRELARLAGPLGEPVEVPVGEDQWDDRVEAMAARAEEGWEPPPVIVAYRQDRLVLEDGNHRVESLRQSGRRAAWAVVGFERPEDRDRFAAQWTGPGASDRQG